MHNVCMTYVILWVGGLYQELYFACRRQLEAGNFFVNADQPRISIVDIFEGLCTYSVAIFPCAFF